MPHDYARNRHGSVENERYTSRQSANVHFQPDDENRMAKTGHSKNALWLLSNLSVTR